MKNRLIFFPLVLWLVSTGKHAYPCDPRSWADGSLVLMANSTMQERGQTKQAPWPFRLEVRCGASTPPCKIFDLLPKHQLISVLGSPPSGRNRVQCGESRKDTAWSRPFLSVRTISKSRSLSQLDQDAQDRRLWRETLDGLCSWEGVKGELLIAL